MSTKYTTRFYIQSILWILSATICFVFFVIQSFVMKSKFKKLKDINKTFIASIMVYFFFFLNSIEGFIQNSVWYNCTKCKVLSQIITINYDMGKGSMWYLFVCRAELSQGMMPIIPLYVFKIFMPIFLISSFIITYTVQYLYIDVDCPNSIDIVNSYCLWISIEFWVAMLGMIQEFGMSIIFTSLFIIPLWNINVYSMNKNAKITKKKYKKELIKNILLTSIAMFSSLIYFAYLIAHDLTYWGIFHTIDIALNSICCFIMMTSNTTYITEKIQFCSCNTNVNNFGNAQLSITDIYHSDANNKDNNTSDIIMNSLPNAISTTSISTNFHAVSQSASAKHAIY